MNIFRSYVSVVKNLSCETKVACALDRAFANFSDITSQKNEKNICLNLKMIKRLLFRVLTDLLINEADVTYGCEVVEMALVDIRNWESSFKSLIPEIFRRFLSIHMFRFEVRHYLQFQSADLEIETFVRLICGYNINVYLI